MDMYVREEDGLICRLIRASLTFALIVFFFILYKLIAQRWFFKKLPGPPHSFLYGHLPVMFQIATRFPPGTHPQFFYTEIARQYNLQGIWYLDLWPFAPGCVILNDPDLHEEVTVRKPLPVHHVADSVTRPVIGKGAIVTNNGILWRKLHKMMAPAFSWKHIRDMTGIIVEEGELFRQALEKRAGTGAPFSMLDLSSKLIFDVMARVVFNTRVHAQTTGSRYLTDLREMIHLAEGQLTDPMVAYNPVKRVQVWWKRRQISSRLDANLRNLVNQRLNLLREQRTVPLRHDPHSILDLMVREHVMASVGEGEEEMTAYELPEQDMELILTNLKGALIGNHGTTTDSLCYAMMLLTKYPNCVAKMRKEHEEVFSQSSAATKRLLLSDPCKLQDLPYTEAVLKEALRLFPLGMPLREAEPGSTLHSDGGDLPIGGNGLVIVLNPQDIHYNPEFFDNPSDFDPERWLDPEKPIPKENFRSFSRGNRACLGMNLAMNVMKLVLVMVMRDYDFRCADLRPNPATRAEFVKLDEIFGDVVFQEIGLEAKPRGPLRMLVKKRKQI